MNFDDIRKNLDKIIAERLKFHEDALFGQLRQGQQDAFRAQEEARRRMHDDRAQAFAFGFSGFRDGQGRMAFPDDGKTITLGKDDYRVLE